MRRTAEVGVGPGADAGCSEGGIVAKVLERPAEGLRLAGSGENLRKTGRIVVFKRVELVEQAWRSAIGVWWIVMRPSRICCGTVGANKRSEMENTGRIRMPNL